MQFYDERLPQRFWDKVSPCPATGCWLWVGASEANGYGRYNPNGKPARVHRVAYRALVGPIPEELVIDHLCHNRLCCNPLHLETVTSRVNAARSTSPWAVNTAKKSCKRGHPFDAVNTIFVKKGRQCRACRDEANRCRYPGYTSKFPDMNRKAA